MKKIKLERDWNILEPIGSGGFGQVFRVLSGDQECALKLIPKKPGAQRELLFTNLAGAENIIPILEEGETENDWALIMPLADGSLHKRLKSGNPISSTESIKILIDVCVALASLADLDEPVVHRDIKPQNILLLDGKWCLADFGISRYAEASTDDETRKYASTPPYCAPERWRLERATAASDIYSVGIIMYELFTGRRPYNGPNFREEHLHKKAASMDGVSASIAALGEECLYKAPEARPTAANMVARLNRIKDKPNTRGRSKLSSANLMEVKRKSEEAQIQSQKVSEEERRKALFDVAELSLNEIAASLFEVIFEEAPAAQVFSERNNLRAQIFSEGKILRAVRLGSADLTLSKAIFNDLRSENFSIIDIIGHATIRISFPQDEFGYGGRSHSLWFCDALIENNYAWYETAFMFHPFANKVSVYNPFSLTIDSAIEALRPAMGKYQVAWPFEKLERGDLGEFIDRWVSWFADAAMGNLHHPSTMPERDPNGSWRKK